MGIHYFNCIICGVSLQNTEVITNKKVCKKIIEYYSGLKNFTYYPEFSSTAIEETYYFAEDNIFKDNKKKAIDNEQDLREEFYDDANKSLEYIKKNNWLSDVIGILNNKIVSIILEHEDHYKIHDIEGNNYDEQIYNNTDVNNDIYIMHNSCYKLLKKNNFDITYQTISDYNYNLKQGIEFLTDKKGKIIKNYFNKKPIIKQNIEQNISNLDYGIIKKYKGAYNSFCSYLCYENDRYLLEDPLKNKQNAKRILDLKLPFTNVSTFVKKKTLKKIRPSPSESATLFQVNDQKKGNDGNIYIISIDKNGTKRWKKLIDIK